MDEGSVKYSDAVARTRSEVQDVCEQTARLFHLTFGQHSQSMVKENRVISVNTGRVSFGKEDVLSTVQYDGLSIMCGVYKPLERQVVLVPMDLAYNTAGELEDLLCALPRLFSAVRSALEPELCVRKWIVNTQVWIKEELSYVRG